jgi:hypothetical protein
LHDGGTNFAGNDRRGFEIVEKRVIICRSTSAFVHEHCNGSYASDQKKRWNEERKIISSAA